MPAHTQRILTISLTSGLHLHDADALAEFDAVIVDQLMELLASDHGLRVAPATQKTDDAGVLPSIRAAMHRRTQEAAQLMIRGGVLVVRLRPLGVLVEPVSLYMPSTRMLDFYTSGDWWIDLEPRLKSLRHDHEQTLVHPATGPAGRVLEPSHTLEPYLREARYTAVLDALVTTTAGCSVLAINGGAEPLAAQIPMGEGLLLIVPSEGDETLLEHCVLELLDLRSAYRDDWRLPAEQEALSDLTAADLEFRARRDAPLARLREIRSRKRRVLEQRSVQRVLDYYRSATATGNSRQRSVEHLHKIVEVIADEIGSVTKLRSTLAVTKRTVDAITHLANRPEVDARHANVDEPRNIADDEMTAALAAAAQIVQRYVEYRERLLPVPVD
jgi:hypothetical protein